MSLHRAGTSPEGGGHNWGGGSGEWTGLEVVSVGPWGSCLHLDSPAQLGQGFSPGAGSGARRTKGIGSGCGEGTGPGLQAQGPRGLPKAARGVSAVDLGEATGQVSRRVRPAGAARAVLRTEGRTPLTWRMTQDTGVSPSLPKPPWTPVWTWRGLPPPAGHVKRTANGAQGSGSLDSICGHGQVPCLWAPPRLRL